MRVCACAMRARAFVRVCVCVRALDNKWGAKSGVRGSGVGRDLSAEGPLIAFRTSQIRFLLHFIYG